MFISFLDRPFPEPSARTGFSGNRLERLSEKRGDDVVDQALRDPAVRIMLHADGRLLLDFSSGEAEPFFSPAVAASFGADPAKALLLGADAAGPVLAVALPAVPEPLPDGIKAIDYRSIYVQGLLDGEATGALAQGAALLNWHASHRFCSRCGHESKTAAGGVKRICASCGAEHFPRTDPVAIMLTVSGERCLLGRGPRFAPGVYSALAGFIEPGETIEDAVRRETFEEAGVRLGRVAYHASQPWPFPCSLMIGCYGEALGEDIRFDADELEDCRWFTRDEVLLALDGEHPSGVVTPPRMAIAHLLIRDWAEAGD